MPLPTSLLPCLVPRSLPRCIDHSVLDLAQPEHAALFSLLGVVAVLSAPDLLQRSRATGDREATDGASPEAQRSAVQLEVADVILLNKGDLLKSVEGQEVGQPQWSAASAETRAAALARYVHSNQR